MSHLELNELTQVEKFFDEFKLKEAIESLDDLIQLNDINHQQKSFYQYLRGQILLWQGKYEEAINWGKKIFQESQDFNERLQSIDGLSIIITGLIQSDKFDEAKNFIEQAENLLRSISHVSENDLMERKVRIKVARAHLNCNISNIASALECLEWVLSIQKELDNQFEFAYNDIYKYSFVYTNILMAYVMIYVKSRYDLGMEYTKNALAIAENMNFNHMGISLCQFYFGLIYSATGEIDLSLKSYLKSLTIFKKLENRLLIGGLKNNIGLLYSIKGEYNLALKYLEESLLFREQQSLRIDTNLDSLIFVALEKGDIELAQKYYHRLEKIHNQIKDPDVILLRIYDYNKALMLKSSPRIRDKVKTEELFKQVIESETVSFDIRINALVHLCDVLLTEFSIDNDIEILNEINKYVAQLLTIAENSHSYLVFCETYILQAKLSLLNFNMKAARRFLSQAQKIAESYGIKRLAMKISHEHDELLKKLNIWEALKKSDASLSERWKFARLNEQIEHMVKKRIIEIPEFPDEEPVLLLIVSEGGIPLFSQSFIEDKYYEDYLFGGFFTAINSFIHEKFSERLDRAIFGEYTLLMNSISPFFICYIYKGQSYSAQHRVKSFINEIQSRKEVWDTFEKFYKLNKEVELKDLPSLKSLIKEIFIDKSIVLSN